MRLLLDTHIALWFVTGDDRLNVLARNLIADPSSDKSVSIASLWEVSIKNNLGRTVRDPIGLPVQKLATEFTRQFFTILDLHLTHFVAVERLPCYHRDPFDRLIIAQAEVERMTLLTHDDTLARYGEHIINV